MTARENNKTTLKRTQCSGKNIFRNLDFVSAVIITLNYFYQILTRVKEQPKYSYSDIVLGKPQKRGQPSWFKSTLRHKKRLYAMKLIQTAADSSGGCRSNVQPVSPVWDLGLPALTLIFTLTWDFP